MNYVAFITPRGACAASRRTAVRSAQHMTRLRARRAGAAALRDLARDRLVQTRTCRSRRARRVCVRSRKRWYPDGHLLVRVRSARDDRARLRAGVPAHEVGVPVHKVWAKQSGTVLYRTRGRSWRRPDRGDANFVLLNGRSRRGRKAAAGDARLEGEMR